MFKFIFKLSRIIPKGDIVLRMLYGCEIPKSVKFGKNVSFGHKALGVVINGAAVIGDNVFIQHHVLIGQRNGEENVPIIKDNVLIESCAIIIGNVVIGENATIGAGSLVTHDVPPNTVFYNPRQVVIKNKV